MSLYRLPNKIPKSFLIVLFQEQEPVIFIDIESNISISIRLYIDTVVIKEKIFEPIW